MTVYQAVKQILERHPNARDKYNMLVNVYLYEYCEWDWELLPCVESITRAFREVVKNHQELWPSRKIEELRNNRYEEAVVSRGNSIVSGSWQFPLDPK